MKRFSLLACLLCSQCGAQAGTPPSATADAVANGSDAPFDGQIAAETAADVKVPGLCDPADSQLRLHHVQMLGTHNSYHVAKPKPLVAQWDYTHSPLAVQLDQEGVRAFEFDLHFVAPGMPIEVKHVPGMDDGTRCATIGDCLGQLKAWSDAHPCHHPLVVTLEAKDELTAEDVADHLPQLEQQILAAVPGDRLVKPDDLRGSFADLASAAAAGNWPTLGQSRGKLLVIAYDKEELFSKYKKLRPGLQGAPFFVFGKLGDPDTATVLADNPFDPALGKAVQAGCIVRTFPEPTHAESAAAFTAGAHVVSTDHPVPKPRMPGFGVQLPGGAPSRCNPVTAPPSCTAAAVNAGIGQAVAWQPQPKKTAWGEVTGACATAWLAQALAESAPSFHVNTYSFASAGPFDAAPLRPLAAKRRTGPNNGGSSNCSEAMSIQTICDCEGAKALKLELDIAFTEKGQTTDWLGELGGVQFGVSVSRVYLGPKATAYSEADATKLLEKKLGGINASTALVAARDKWKKQVLHLWTLRPDWVPVVEQAWTKLPAAVKADTAVLVTVEVGSDHIVTETCKP
ncbi:MAG: hypothetical protein FJ100_07345 [Deltaproteobacteria bacterium]|nr:hypothetical protein [Deltaproteobacteria bacterium]